MKSETSPNRTQNWKFLAAVASLLLGLGIYWQHQQQSKKINSSTANESLYTKAKNFPGLSVASDKTKSPLTTRLSDASEKSSQAECESFNQKIETLPLNTLLFDLQEKHLAIPPSCAQDERTTALFQALSSACQSEAQNSNPLECEGKLFQYRARRIQLWSNSQDLKSLSSEVLVQKFYGLMSSGEMTLAGGGPLLRSISDELKLRLPDSSAPQRIDVISYLVEPPQTEEQNRAADEALRLAREKNPTDWQLFEIDLIRKPPADYEAQVRAFADQYPSSPIALYHLGCIAWKKGFRDEALQYFQRALSLAPTDTRFLATNERARSEATGASICTAQMSFDSRDF